MNEDINIEIDLQLCRYSYIVNRWVARTHCDQCDGDGWRSMFVETLEEHFICGACENAFFWAASGEPKTPMLDDIPF